MNITHVLSSWGRYLNDEQYKEGDIVLYQCENVRTIDFYVIGNDSDHFFIGESASLLYSAYWADFFGDDGKPWNTFDYEGNLICNHIRSVQIILANQIVCKLS